MHPSIQRDFFALKDSPYIESELGYLHLSRWLLFTAASYRCHSLCDNTSIRSKSNNNQLDPLHSRLASIKSNQFFGLMNMDPKRKITSKTTIQCSNQPGHFAPRLELIKANATAPIRIWPLNQRLLFSCQQSLS